MHSLMQAIESRENTYCVIINSTGVHGDARVNQLFQDFSHPQCMMIDMPFNTGQTLASKFFFQTYITETTLPKTVLSVDPDVLFSPDSFNYLVQASEALPQCGMIGMRYKKNSCNPERNIVFKPKRLTGQDKNDYAITCPFMCTVAGPVFAVSGHKLWHECQNRLFPSDRVFIYGGADSSLYAKLRWRYYNGYLEGTTATHLQSNGKRPENIPSLLQAAGLIDYDKII